jgi:hypothetical protein
MYRVTARRLSIYNNAWVFSTVHLQIMEKIIRTQKKYVSSGKESKILISIDTATRDLVLSGLNVQCFHICLVRNMDHPWWLQAPCGLVGQHVQSWTVSKHLDFPGLFYTPGLLLLL